MSTLPSHLQLHPLPLPSSSPKVKIFQSIQTYQNLKESTKGVKSVYILFLYADIPAAWLEAAVASLMDTSITAREGQKEASLLLGSSRVPRLTAEDTHTVTQHWERPPVPTAKATSLELCLILPLQKLSSQLN